MRQRDFTVERLTALLRLGASFNTFWRHDVDVSLEAAYEMATLERKLGISATYYLFLGADSCPFYLLSDARKLERILKNMGHTVGIHTDERTYGTRLALGGSAILRGKDVSFHCPSREVLWRDFRKFKNAYASKWMGFYIADSTGRFKYGDPEDKFSTDCRLQVNLHPVWWFDPLWEKNVDIPTYENFFGVQHPYTVGT